MAVRFYVLKRDSQYRDFSNYAWTNQIDENCLLTEYWLVEEIRDREIIKDDKDFKGNYEIITFELKEVKEDSKWFGDKKND